MSSVHVSLFVSDLEKSVSFYRGLFGEPKKLKADYAKFVGEDPEIHLALQPGLRPGAPSGPLSHFGIRVDSSGDVRRRLQELKARGAVSDAPVRRAEEDAPVRRAEEVAPARRAEEGVERRETCCYATQDKFWLTDPDGNRWEVYTVLEDVEDEVREPRSACCPAQGGSHG